MHQKFEQFVLTEDPSNVRLIPKLELVKVKTEELKDSPKNNHEYYVGFQACWSVEDREKEGMTRKLPLNSGLNAVDEQSEHAIPRDTSLINVKE